MAHTIELKLDRDLTDEEVHKLRILLNDAFGEFMDTREDVAGYVRKRYPDLSRQNHINKCNEVTGRLELARLIKNADITVKPTMPQTAQTASAFVLMHHLSTKEVEVTLHASELSAWKAARQWMRDTMHRHDAHAQHEDRDNIAALRRWLDTEEFNTDNAFDLVWGSLTGEIFAVVERPILP
jgi:hypothetical protein